MKPDPTSRLQQLRLIWLAIVSSTIIYGLIAWLVIEPTTDTSTEKLYSFVSNPLSFVLAIAAMAAFFASIVIPGMMIRSRRTARQPGVPAGTGGNRESSETVTAMIVRYVLLEAPAVLGLLGAFILQEWRFFLPFGALSLLGLALTAPTEALIRSLDISAER